MKKLDKMLEGYKLYIKKAIPIKAIQINEEFQVDTLEGIMKAKSGDYLIEGIKGELYSCDKEIFNMTYKPKPDKSELEILEEWVRSKTIYPNTVANNIENKFHNRGYNQALYDLLAKIRELEGI